VAAGSNPALPTKNKFMNYFVFIISLIIGAWLVIKTEKMLSWFGPNEWAEEKLGLYGGSRLFYKMLGLIIIIAGTMFVTGWAQDLLLAIFAPKK
jgi:ABC-type phosphate transport system permease subunit